jgi:hypothetical protein
MSYQGQAIVCVYCYSTFVVDTDMVTSRGQDLKKMQDAVLLQ